MIRAIDHIVILVADLAAASADYAALGFTVTPGGEHTDGATHNALVVFADDTYLELIAFQRQAPGHRWWRHSAAGEGLVDYALLPGAIEEDIAGAQARGAAYSGPASGGRLRPDGQQVSWQLGMPPSADLPFLCGDVTPRVLRVPGGAARQHPNGVTGIAGLTIAVDDLEASVARYRALLGRDPIEQLPAPPGARFAAFAIGGAVVTLVAAYGETAPASEDSLRTRLAAHGAGPYALTLRAESAANAGPLDPARTHGVPLDLVIA
jgi:catechol 2,3-dioxygenase-like lactoylglutathione lyase family enzyme